MNARSLCLLLAGAVAAAMLVAGCSADQSLPATNDVDTDLGLGGDSHGHGNGILTIDPNSAHITVHCPAGAKVSPDTVQLQALLDGKNDPTVKWKSADAAALSVDQSGLVTFICPMRHGGKYIVTAIGAGIAAADIIVDLIAPDVIAPGTSPDVAMAFDGPHTGDKVDDPVVLYPIDGAMHAVNLTQLTFQWRASIKHSLFRLHAVGATIDATFYVGSTACTPNSDPNVGGLLCAYQPPAVNWRTVIESVPGDSVAMTVSATAGKGQTVSDAAPVTLNVSPEAVRGGLYYFSLSTQGLKRLPFGSVVVSTFVNGGPNSKYLCVGCHTVSPDGKKVAATFFSGDGFGGVIDGANAPKFLVPPMSGTSVNRWNFAAFSPDGSLLLTSWAGTFTLRNGDTGAKKFDVDPKITGGKAIMPEWSPDGNRVAFVQLPAEGRLGSEFPGSKLLAGDWDCGNTGNIAVMKYEAGTFQPATVVVPSVLNSEYHYSPSWSPDSQFIVFVTATAPGRSDTAWQNIFGVQNPQNIPPNYVMTYDQVSTRLRLVASDGGTPIELTNATHLAGRSPSTPHFAPFRQGNFEFLSFSAKLDYGHLVTDGKMRQLWMSGIDIGRALMDQGATDPSYPPVWLPFQLPHDMSRAAYWTQAIACANSDQCGTGFTCQGGVCVAPVSP